MPNLTPNFSFNLPLVNNAIDADLWGGYLNSNWSGLDTSLSLTTSVKSADFLVSLDEFNYTYLIDASAGNVTATLPAASSVFNGFTVRFKPTDVTNAITIDGNGTETIDGEETRILTGLNEVFAVVCDGTNWIINASPLSTETVVGGVEKGTPSELQTETADKNIVADNMLNHPAAVKAWGYFDASSGSVSGFEDEYNMVSVSRTSTGSYLLTMANPMTATNYVVVASGTQTSGIGGTGIVDVQINTTTQFRLNLENADSNQRDGEIWFAVYGTLA